MLSKTTPKNYSPLVTLPMVTTLLWCSACVCGGWLEGCEVACQWPSWNWTSGAALWQLGKACWVLASYMATWPLRLHSLRLAPPTQQKGTKWLRGYSKLAANKHENNRNPNSSHLDLKHTRWLNLCCWSKSTCLV